MRLGAQSLAYIGNHGGHGLSVPVFGGISHLDGLPGWSYFLLNLHFLFHAVDFPLAAELLRFPSLAMATVTTTAPRRAFMSGH